MKIAIPVEDGKVAMHFGHAKEFAVFEAEGPEIKDSKTLEPPPHEPGAYPSWLHGLGVNVVITGGMGGRAISYFMEKGIKVLTGAPSLAPEEAAARYLSDSLKTAENVCDH